jgi:glycosyltransferase involved in cell wall biosynthesis
VLQEIKNVGLESDIIITGYLEDNVIPYLYNLALLKIYPSVYEGFGLPVLEGYASGVPVVCSRSSSMLELSCSEEMLFDCFSPNDICEKMKLFLEKGEQRNMQLALQFDFLKKFSWAKTAEKTVEIYNWVSNTKRF